MDLVTGSSGFIGSHLVDFLRNKNRKVVGVDKVKPARNGFDDYHFVQHNLSKELLCKLNSHYNTIYHLAARPWSMVNDPKNWIKETNGAYADNVHATQRLLQKCNSKLIVFTSTANLYGNGRKFKEEDPFFISSPYGYTKAIAERMIALSGRKYVIFRFGTVVGTRGRCFPNRLVWCSINNVPVEIFNNGDTYRDIIDVRDVLSALFSANHLEDGIYNISSGREIDGKALADMVDWEADNRGYELNYELTSFKAPGYVPYSTINISKILKTKIWRPKIKLARTISDLFDYYEKPNAIEPPSWEDI